MHCRKMRRAATPCAESPCRMARAPNLHVVNLSGLVTDTVDHWRTKNFSPEAIAAGLAADTASPAGDGVANLLKYSLGWDPAVIYPPGTVTATGLDAGGHLTMTVAKNPLAAEVSLTIEVTGSLADSATWDAAGTTVDQNTTTTFQAHDNTPVSAAQARFIRLKVTRP